MQKHGLYPALTVAWPTRMLLVKSGHIIDLPRFRNCQMCLTNMRWHIACLSSSKSRQPCTQRFECPTIYPPSDPSIQSLNSIYPHFDALRFMMTHSDEAVLCLRTWSHRTPKPALASNSEAGKKNWNKTETTLGVEQHQCICINPA